MLLLAVPCQAMHPSPPTTRASAAKDDRQAKTKNQAALLFFRTNKQAAHMQQLEQHG
jgi:hypothetical protein